MRTPPPKDFVDRYGILSRINMSPDCLRIAVCSLLFIDEDEWDEIVSISLEIGERMFIYRRSKSLIP